MANDLFLKEVETVVGAAYVKTKPADVESYSVDWKKRYFGKPLAVVLPANTEQVAAVVKLANQHQIGLVPQGGNTGLTGAGVPDDSGSQVVLSLSRLKNIRAKDPENKTLTLEVGITLQQVQEIADSMGLLFPLSLGAEGTATIGGNLSTNAGGTGVLRYGNARDLCLGVEVVTATGEIWNGLRALRKDNTGYDLRDLFVGSEGTLGIITAAVLKLFPKPAGVMTALAQVSGPKDALRVLQIAQKRCDAALTGFEFMASISTQFVTTYYPDVARFAFPIIGGGDSGVPLSDCVLLEISHPESEQAATQMLEAVMEQAIEEGIVSDAIVAQSQSQAKAMWHMRETITLGAADDGAQAKHDIAVPISSILDFIEQMDAELLAAYPGVRISNFGHFGDGNLHYNIAPPEALAAGKSKAERHAAFNEYLAKHEDDIHKLVHDRVASLNGSISAEHGLGVMRRDEAKRYKSPIELQLMRTIKQALDPKGILNPGKVL